MNFIEDYGSTVLAAAIGTLIGGVALGVALYYGEDKDIPILKTAADGFST